MRYIGFDMGDGESAVAIFQQGSGIEPIIQPIGGSRSLLSAVGRVHGEIVIGEQAYTDALAEGLSVRFKSRFTYDTGSYEDIVLFAKGVLRALKEADAIHDQDVLVVGCPAAWNAASRRRYHDLLLRAGFGSLQIISESRAAFLYAKYAKTVALEIDVVSESALVIDMGSSTLDFAYIVDGRETGVGTFGDIRLGGGVLDEELLRRAVENSRNKEKIKEVFRESKSWRSYCEIEARKLKERYFSQEPTDPKTVCKKQIRIRYDGVQQLQLFLDAYEAASLVEEPIAALNGISFAQAFDDALNHAKQITSDSPPQVVLLAGGTSRMRIVQEQCRQVFGDALVVCCPDPEFSVAKGLAYSGWVDENLREFRKAVAEQITNESVSSLARAALPSLTPKVAKALVDLILREAAIPVVLDWKHGDIDTLDAMTEQLQRRVENVLQSPGAEAALRPIIAAWVNGLADKMQAMVDPICDQHLVPRRDMELSFSQSGEAGKITVDARNILGLKLVGTMVGVVVSVLGGILCGGSGIALITAGPLGFLAGIVIGAILAVVGWSGLSGVLLKAKLPRFFRWINVERRLLSDGVVRGLRDAMLKEINAKDSEFSNRVIMGFTEAFQRYLHKVAQAAEIPIW
ncbi:MAG: Hsp70 family protein [Clostridia bacterium]|nr:Hsp70 family protein [Clostridia bacterium]